MFLWNNYINVIIINFKKFYLVLTNSGMILIKK
jgi:hypothetical protein